MRIAMTVHRFLPHIGGTELAVDALATRFAAKGHEITVVTATEGAEPREEAFHGYCVRRYPLRHFGKFRVPPREYRSLILDGHFDLVHLHGQRVWSSDHLYRHLPRAKVPIVFTAHGFAQWHRRRKPIVDAAYYKLVLPRALRSVSCVTALTARERTDLISFGVPEDKIVVIGDGYEPAEFRALPAGFRERFGFSAEERLLLYAGGFYPNKRVDRLVEAVAGLDATLVVLGANTDGSRAGIEAFARARGAKLRALGRLPRDDVLSAYRECDLFLLGSDFEGYGLVLLEAMAAGLPFVSTPCGAAPELAETGAGLIAADALVMREDVRALLADDTRRHIMARRGRESAPAYPWDHVADQYLQLFEGVARR